MAVYNSLPAQGPTCVGAQAGLRRPHPAAAPGRPVLKPHPTAAAAAAAAACVFKTSAVIRAVFMRCEPQN